MFVKFASRHYVLTALAAMTVLGLLAYITRPHSLPKSDSASEADSERVQAVPVSLVRSEHDRDSEQTVDSNSDSAMPGNTQYQEPAFLAQSEDWSYGRVVAEKFQNDPDETGYQRHRILEDTNLGFPVHLVERQIESSTGLSWILDSAQAANQIILNVADDVDLAEAHDIAAVLGWEVVNSRSSEYLVVIQADSYDFDKVADGIAAIELSGTAIVAEPNTIFYTMLSPNDAKYSSSSQWGLEHPSDYDIDAPEGWNIRTSAANVTVAVIDTGIRLDHEDLKDNLWSDARGSNGANTVAISNPPMDDNGHGTHVAGIIGAVGNNNIGISGVAWNVKMIAVKSLNAEGKGSSDSIVAGIDYAIKNGANVINASWGSASYSYSLEQAIIRAQRKGVIFVTSAGNDSSVRLPFPASSALDNVIAVGSVSRDGRLSSFSNYNNEAIDVLAPGDGILSTWHYSQNAYSNQ